MRLEQLIQGDDSVQQHVASEREKAALVAVSPMARKAIEKEVVPQLEAHVTSVKSVDELGDQTKKDIEAAFKGKTEIYTRLIQYKSIDQSDTQFLDDLLYVMDEWVAKTKKVLDDGKPADPGEVKVKVEIESDLSVKTETGDNTEVKVKDTSSGEKLPISVADIFDLGDVRF